MTEKPEWISGGEFSGTSREDSQVIFNDLLDGLIRADFETTEPETVSAVASIFKDFITKDDVDEVFKDYAIQRSLMWVEAEAAHPHRAEMISHVLSQFSDQNEPCVYLGTALNVMMAYKANWTPQEWSEMQQSVRPYVAKMTSIQNLPHTVAIPVLYAIDTMQLSEFTHFIQAAKLGADLRLKQVASRF